MTCSVVHSIDVETRYQSFYQSFYQLKSNSNVFLKQIRYVEWKMSLKHARYVEWKMSLKQTYYVEWEMLTF